MCMDVMKKVVAFLEKPHYQKLNFNTTEGVETVFGREYNFYNQQLQDSLLKFDKHKMPVTVSNICFNTDKMFINNGGQIRFGINNIKTEKENEKCFSALKSLSVYSKYLFSDVVGDSILAVYGDLYYLFPNIKKVSTYTMVYVCNENNIREITLHKFEGIGNLFTSLDLKLSDR